MHIQPDKPEKIIEYMRNNEGESEFLKNALIESYTPFIIGQIAKVTGRYVEIENDEMLSIGLMAFNEAISRYNPEKNPSFVGYAALVIGSRVKDQLKSKSYNEQWESLDSMMEEDPSNVPEVKSNTDENLVSEIQTWEQEIQKFGFDLEILVDESPKHKDTRQKAVDLSEKISNDDEITTIMFKKYRLPISRVVLKFKTTQKVVKGSKRFIIAVVIIFTKKLTSLESWVVDIKGGVGRAFTWNGSEN